MRSPTVEPLDVDFSYDVPDWARDKASKRAVVFHARQAREFLAGAISLLREGEEQTAMTATEMAAEAIQEATRLMEARQ